MTPIQMKVHLARCDLGDPMGISTIPFRIKNILDSLVATNQITEWIDHTAWITSGYLDIEWSIGGLGSILRNILGEKHEAKFLIAELRPHLVPIIEVMES